MRKGLGGLAMLTQEILNRDLHDGQLLVFRGKPGDLIKLPISRLGLTENNPLSVYCYRSKTDRPVLSK